MKEKPKSGPVKVAGPGGGVARSIGSKREPELVAEPEAPKSRFTLEECRRFAECGFQKGSVSNPTNYARAIHRSGAVDGTIERFLWEEKFRLERQQEVALIEARHKQEIEELEKAVGQATRAWAAERAAPCARSNHLPARCLCSAW